ncbi:MAG: sugar ABC transporter substrate-binding protein [Ancalomicrobiaceae bacterium]|nr:sugar ABC transporter substrate-binding protein [Ancalomicrobiaceae bacterium]
MRALKIGLMAGLMLASAWSGAAFAEQVTLNFWVCWDPSQADGKAAPQEIAKFEAAHPDIKIKVQIISYDALHTKLVTAVAGGDAPDLSWGLIEWFGELNRMGALEDLTGDAANWPDKDKVYPNALAAVTANGKLMALPNYLGIRALLVHTELLKQAGVEPPKTWDELVAAAKKIQATTGKPGFGIAGRGVRAPQELLSFFAQNDVQIATPTADGKYKNTWASNPEELGRAAEVYTFYRRMVAEGTVPKQAAGWGWEEEDTNFAFGQYAMVVNGSWMGGRLTTNPKEMADVRVTAPPAGRKAATFFEVAPYYIFKGKHPKETWEFASFLMSKDYQTSVYRDRSPRSDVQGDEIWGKPFTALAPIGVGFPPVALGAITRDMEDSIGRVLLKNEDPKAVAEWLGKQVNKSLKQNGELGD